MIHVIITGPPSGTGWMPYKVDFPWRGGRPQLIGLARAPLYDACRRLKQYGLMDDTVVGLFRKGDPEHWVERTTVGYGATHMPYQNPYREFPGGPLKHAPPVPPPQPNVEPVKAGLSEWSNLNDVTPATPKASQPRPHTLPERPVGTAEHRVHHHPEPAKSAKSHHPPKRGGSGARRGSR